MFKAILIKAEKLAAPKYFPAAAALLAALAAMPWSLDLSGVYETVLLGPAAEFVSAGKSLFYGVYDQRAGSRMPLFSLIAALFLGEYSRTGTNLLLLLFGAGNYFLTFAAAAAGGRRAAGLAAVLAALALNLTVAGTPELEQVVYSFFLLLLLNLLVRRRAGSPLRNAFAGLGVGVTLLVRSTLALFPLFLAAWEYLGARYLRRPWAPPPVRPWKMLVFVAASYVLLLPWTGFNYFLYKKVLPIELNRIESAAAAAALGGVYNMEFDYKSAAGINPGASALGWAAGQTLRAPLRYLGGAARRALEILLLHPQLFALLVCALLYYRTREVLAALPLFVYFAGIHCLVAVEGRYLYPLTWFTAFLAGSAVYAVPGERRPASGRVTVRLTLAAALCAAATLVFVMAYPFRADPRGGLRGVESALRLRPGDVWLYKKKAEILLLDGQQSGAIEALRQAHYRSGGRDLAALYTADLLAFRGSGRLPEPPDGVIGLNRWSLLVVKGLRELELGQLTEARLTLRAAYAAWTADSLITRGPGAAAAVAEPSSVSSPADARFLQYCLNRAAFYWPEPAWREVIRRFKEIYPEAAGMEHGVQGKR